MKNEIWRECQDVGSVSQPYEISNLGQVRSLNFNKTGKTQIMKLHPSPSGHLFVKTAGKEVHSVAGLVLKSFGNDTKPEGSIVFHKDRNPENNNIENLCYKSQSEINKNNGRTGHKYTKK